MRVRAPLLSHPVALRTLTLYARRVDTSWALTVEWGGWGGWGGWQPGASRHTTPQRPAPPLGGGDQQSVETFPDSQRRRQPLTPVGGWGGVFAAGDPLIARQLQFGEVRCES